MNRLFGYIMISATFFANVTAAPFNKFAVCKVPIVDALAETNTSAGAPLTICVASVADDP
jgi:hypothetical protein